MQQPEMEQPAAVSEVLGNGDLLDQILLRLDIPVFLVLASRVDKTWRSRAMDRVFLGRFRARLTRRPRPRPLGFYVTFEDAFGIHLRFRTKFVPMSQRPELADVISRFGDNLDAGEESRVLDCRNGRVLLILRRHNNDSYAVLGPLDPVPAVALLPPLPPSVVPNTMISLLADYSRQARDRTLCAAVGFSSMLNKDMVRLSLLQDDYWVDDISCATGLSATLGYPIDQLLVGDNLYMLSSNGCIVCLDLTSMRFLVIELPDGVETNKLCAEEHTLSRAYDDFGIYFIQFKGLHLRVWVCKSDGDYAGTWMLEADISLPKAFGDLAVANLTDDEDSDTDDEKFEVLRLLSVGDNADFVFLVDGGLHFLHIFYLDIRTRNVEQVYRRLLKDGEVFCIRHFMMT